MGSKAVRSHLGKRHRWGRTGAWGGSKDPRTCTVCGLVAYKTGMYSGYMVRFSSNPETFTRRMPACGGLTARSSA